MHKLFTLALLFSVNQSFAMEETKRPTTLTRRERAKSPSCDSPEQLALQQKLDQEEAEEKERLLALYPPLPTLDNKDLRKKFQKNRYAPQVPKDKKQPKKGSLPVRRSISDSQLGAKSWMTKSVNDLSKLQ